MARFFSPSCIILGSEFKRAGATDGRFSIIYLLELISTKLYNWTVFRRKPKLHCRLFDVSVPPTSSSLSAASWNVGLANIDDLSCCRSERPEIDASSSRLQLSDINYTADALRLRR